MPLIEAARSTLVLIDLQARLMPAIHEGARIVAEARRLLAGARELGVPTLATEQYPQGLGATVPELDYRGETIAKTGFDACAEAAFLAAVPKDRLAVVAGCEAHVCVLQTVLGLRAAGREVVVVEDAIGSRAPHSKAAALTRMARHGAEIATVEMVLFEWLRDAKHPSFKAVSALIR